MKQFPRRSMLLFAVTVIVGSLLMALGLVAAQTYRTYNSDDRLLSSSDAKLTSPVYDAHGNTASLGSGSTVTTFTYDASDRNTSMAGPAREGHRSRLYPHSHRNGRQSVRSISGPILAGRSGEGRDTE